MDYALFIKKVSSLEFVGIRLGLSRIKGLLHKFNYPRNLYPVIHITGTNGKGSTAAYISEILRLAGYKVGTYTSPHIIDLRERIKVNNEMISKEMFLKIGEKVLKMSSNLTYFEFITSVALLYFREVDVDYIVLEVGLGGRLDATNVIEGTKVAVITNIGYEHTNYLGETLKEIATEKSEIIKKGAVVVSGVSTRYLAEIIRKVGERKHMYKFVLLNRDFSYKTIKYSTLHNIFDYYGMFDVYKNLRTKLIGSTQVFNASLAIAAVEALQHFGVYISENAIRYGIYNTYIPGRMEIKKAYIGSKKVRFIFDVAHNPMAFQSLVENIKLLNLRPNVTIVGILNDKDYKTMVKIISSITDYAITLQLETPRSMDTALLAAELRKYLPKEKVFSAKNATEAIKQLSKIVPENSTVLVTGSFYTVSGIKSEIIQYIE